ncbi:hypothetical protein C6P46_006749 [Rhodotorula mucilaginosa]|uniref:NADH dehydrogenase [ubiquinone] 1 alpha subcomplex subunit n=1 Tax=Rhodotorula mucilaginosa TaxID=5537 RepID=A0A9P6VXW2_RHOMI|nr:hypothetical protein C6P46_006749 [Rhodotorula mucilaginosa]TKA50597.1 hypothetical protein B0A53_06075 [Rhodotorula sp. CCFEE 5036]
MSLFRSAARRLGLGKYRYWQGTDLQGNNFFERPHPEFPDEWRKNKRYVEYYETKPLSDYNYQSIPVQWSSWLRRTRREPPTLEELQKDHLRQLRLRENVYRLEQEYKAEKLRLAEANQAALLQAPAAAAAGRSRSTDATTAAVDLKAQEGLPADRGGVDEATAAKAPEVARNLGLGQKEDTSASEVTTRDDASGSASASPQELAERRRKQEEADAAKRRADFAKENAAPLKAQQKTAQQPEGWAPSAPARRR